MSPNCHRRCRLLLIEDDSADVVLVERAMEQFPDFELRAVDRLQAALAALDAEQFDVALLDLSLPDSFGLEGVEALHARHADLPVVVLTGLSDGGLALEALERGAQDYLSKSQGSPEVLARTLRYAIQRQQIHGENRRLMAELALQACHDPLTGILNRRSLVAELERQWQQAARSGQPLACTILDIDYFKRVNDVHGHAAGDTVLQAVAALLRENCRLGDVCGRYGGEEFLVILPHTTEDGAATWAQRLRQRIAATPIAIDGQSVHVTASFGVAERSPDVADCQQLVDRADQALRMAKQSGRDQVVSFQRACNDASLAGRCDALARLTAADIMLPLVTTLDDQATLRQATALLLNLRLDSAPVVDRQGNLVGVVGEEDLAAALSGSDAWERIVTGVMRSGSACFDARSPATAVHDFLARVAARRVIILDGRRPVGVVSRASILRWRENRNLSLLASLQPEKITPQAARDRLTQLACEVQRQSSALLHGLTNGDGSPAERVVVAATRIQMLLEDVVAHAQRLAGRSPEQGTLGGLMS